MIRGRANAQLTARVNGRQTRGNGVVIQRGIRAHAKGVTLSPVESQMSKKNKYTPTRALLTREQMAMELNTTVPGVDNLRTAGAIPFIKCGHFVRFDRDEVHAALQKLTVKAL